MGSLSISHYVISTGLNADTHKVLVIVGYRATFSVLASCQGPQFFLIFLHVPTITHFDDQI